MAHFAEIDSTNTVVRVVVVADENEIDGADWCSDLFGGTWIQTSYNNRIRKQFAGVGYFYDSDADVFISPQPFPSWSLDSNHDWQPPTPMPDGRWIWNEDDLTWVENPVPTSDHE
jgi:hypothetical protein